MSFSAAPATPTVLLGVAPATLQAWLGQAQQALQSLSTGALTVTVGYAQGDGHRQVTYSRANMADLRAWIGELQAALGVGRRRAIGVVFR